ncbi:hypothetical protein [Bradyrhizobium sp. CCBAU 51627]|uniref:hypothetical protein n=1 Tax=Bradyrhizobium sp. CCBAU 51627 TaxID=1325088 RepID=UPI0023056EBA|nr:hypothetical protein [Bradyrhizobium sp. CCBAU 51627]
MRASKKALTGRRPSFTPRSILKSSVFRMDLFRLAKPTRTQIDFAKLMTIKQPGVLRSLVPDFKATIERMLVDGQSAGPEASRLRDVRVAAIERESDDNSFG